MTRHLRTRTAYLIVLSPCLSQRGVVAARAIVRQTAPSWKGEASLSGEASPAAGARVLACGGALGTPAESEALASLVRRDPERA